MKSFLTTFALALAGLGGFAAADSAVAGDQESIQGTWALEAASLDGKVRSRVSVDYVFEGETLTVHPAGGKDIKGSFKLETTTKPKVLVVQRDPHAPGDEPDRTPYELNGDTLKIAFPSADERLKEISDKGHILFTLKRKKP